MPVNTSGSEIPAPAYDFLTRLTIHREGTYPTVELEFAHCNSSSGTNALGLPIYPRARENTFTLLLSSGIPAALGKIASLQTSVAARMANAETLDSAMANEAYDLLEECKTLGSTTSIRASLGVQILGANPFA